MNNFMRAGVRISDVTNGLLRMVAAFTKKRKYGPGFITGLLLQYAVINRRPVNAGRCTCF